MQVKIADFGFSRMKAENQTMTQVWIPFFFLSIDTFILSEVNICDEMM